MREIPKYTEESRAYFKKYQDLAAEAKAYALPIFMEAFNG